MTSINADPEKLRQLAGAMKTGGQQIEQIARQLRRALDSSGWQDSERQKFEQSLNEVTKGLQRSAEVVRDQLAKQAERKASLLDEFRR